MRPIILTFTGYYLPGYKAGGPIRTIAAMVEQLSDDFEFWIVAADRDLGDHEAYPGVAVNTWQAHGKARVFYRSSDNAGWRALRDSLRDIPINCIYLNSLFSPPATLRPLLQWRLGRMTGAPVLLAPRGELSIGALKIKAMKKRVFLCLAKATGLYRGVVFHASSDYEAADIRRELGNQDIAVALDLSELGGPLRLMDLQARMKQPLRAVFLSRISPMKNLIGALEILRQVRVPLVYDIYGVVEDKDYWAACEAAIASLPGHIVARLRGEVRHEEVERVLADYDFFFLPTHGENYGHVIREALSAGLPALISDQTPWRDLEEKNAGAALPLNEKGRFAAWIEAFAELGVGKRQTMRQAAHEHGNDKVKARRDREANRAMLHCITKRNDM